MTESTIVCPKWKMEIKLTESLAAPLIESTRQQFEQQLAKKTATLPNVNRRFVIRKRNWPRPEPNSMSK